MIVITYANMNESLGGQQLLQLSQYGGFYKVPDTNHDFEQRDILHNIFLGIINENVGTPLSKVRKLCQILDMSFQFAPSRDIERLA